jgi:hypothetical protein
MSETKPTKMGRPPLSEGGRMEYMTFGVTHAEKQLFEDWAWRMRMNKSQLGRNIILRALAEFERDPKMKINNPLPEEAK